MSIAIIIPAYKPEERILDLVRALQQTMPDAGLLGSRHGRRRRA